MAVSQSKSSSTPRGHLPDTTRARGPYRPFASDPKIDEAWWWLALPVVIAIGVIGTHKIDPAFYASWILPEGYGFLELGQFCIAFTAMLMAARLLFRPFVRAHRILFAFCLLATLACLYIAGEEHSWGQHFFHWQTPEYWSQINRQQETNLHNTLHLFDKKPRALLELGVLIGGIAIPLAAIFQPGIRCIRWSIFFPASALMPTAVAAMAFKASDAIQDAFGIIAIVPRPSEAIEFYLYLFILFYLIVLTRRIKELENESRA